MDTLVILGAGGHGRVVADAAICSGWHRVLFFDDAWPQLVQTGPWDVAGGTKELMQHRERYPRICVAVGDNETRLRLLSQLEREGFFPVSVVHPSAVVSPLSELGAGSVVLAGAVVNPFSKIGRGCIINTGATVDHDSLLGDGVHISPGVHLGGDVRIGRRTWVGIGSTVRNGISIGSDVMVGAGAAVVADVDDRVTVAGVPARVMSGRTAAENAAESGNVY